MSITAFPMLSRVLIETKLVNTTIGKIAMGASALNDAAAWLLLIVAVSIANSNDVRTTLITVVLFFGFTVTLLFVVRPLFAHMVNKLETYSNSDLVDHS